MLCFLMMCLPHFLFSQTDHFEFTYKIKGDSSRAVELRMSKGTIITTKILSDSSYQALIICEILDSSWPATPVSSNVWRVLIPAGDSLEITFKGYCFNEDRYAPSMRTGAFVTNLKVSSEDVDAVCAGQKQAWEVVKTQSELLFENVYTRGEVGGKNACIAAFKKAIENIARDKLGGITIYNIKLNGNKNLSSLASRCKIRYTDKVSFSFTQGAEDEVYLINLGGIAKIGPAGTSFTLKYDLKPDEKSREFIEKLITK